MRRARHGADGVARVARRGVLLLLFGLVAGCFPGHPDSPDVKTLDTGRVLDTDAPEIPPEDAFGWRDVTLPDVWPRARRAQGTAGWYSLPFESNGPSETLQGVYVPTVSLNGAVYVNGHPIGDGGDMGDPPSRNWNRPLYFPFPGTLLVPGRNLVQLRLRTTASSFGALTPVEVGPDTTLRTRFALRTFAQVRLREIFAALVLAAGGLLAFVGFRADDVRGAGWLAASAMLWAVASSDALVSDPALPTRLWQWINQMALLGCAVSAVMAAHRTANVPHPTLERVLAGVVIAVALFHALVPTLDVTLATLVNVTVSGLCAMYVVAFAIRHRHLAFYVPGSLAVGAAIVALVLVGHDVALALGAPVPFRYLLFPHVGSLLFLIVSAFVIGRFTRAFQESAALNRDLESRVKEKHAELERNYDRLARLERERVVAAERSRLTRDMHDGVGGQLVAALAMVEHGGVPGEEVAHALRDAIDDLRLVINSIDPTDTDLPTLLGLVRERLEPRLERHGVRFVWKVEDVPLLAAFGPQQALSTLRIVQEAITNVIKHAHAATIEVRTGVATRESVGLGVFLSVRDDGIGLAPEARRGRGLDNMERRAHELGGVLTLEGGPGGTVVHLWFPLDATVGADAAEARHR